MVVCRTCSHSTPNILKTHLLILRSGQLRLVDESEGLHSKQWHLITHFPRTYTYGLPIMHQNVINKTLKDKPLMSRSIGERKPTAEYYISYAIKF